MKPEVGMKVMLKSGAREGYSQLKEGKVYTISRINLWDCDMFDVEGGYWACHEMENFNTIPYIKRNLVEGKLP